MNTRVYEDWHKNLLKYVVVPIDHIYDRVACLRPTLKMNKFLKILEMFKLQYILQRSLSFIVFFKLSSVVWNLVKCILYLKISMLALLYLRNLGRDGVNSSQ